MSDSMTREEAEALLREAGINPAEAPLRSMVGDEVQTLEALVRELRQLVVEAPYDWDSPDWQERRRDALVKTRHLTP